MKKLEITLEDASRLYKTASSEMKELFELNFGKKELSPKIEDRILTFDDVEKELTDNNDPLVDQFVLLMDNDFPAHIIATHQVTMIAKVFNEGTFMGVKNKNQDKYYPWFLTKGSELRFGSSNCSYHSSRVPAHLCFKSKTLSDLAAERFVEIYKRLLS